MDEEVIRTRVNHARIEAYGKFISCKGKDDFYFDTLLNTFLSLVQYPLNFVIFDSRFQPILNFSSDKEHRRRFKEFIDSHGWDENNVFKLFPESLCDPYEVYYIVPVFMRTKRLGTQKPFVAITPMQTNERADLVTKSHWDYISHCTKLFFEEPWKGQHTYFGFTMGESIHTSLEKLKANNIWPPSSKVIHKVSIEVDDPNNIPHNRWMGYDWQRALEKLFSKAVLDSKFGLLGVSGMLHEKVQNVSRIAAIHVPPNLIIGYRAFTRPISSRSRHKNKCGSYPYDAAILVPRKSGTSADSAYSSYLEHLKKIYSINPESYNSIDNQRCLYSDLLNGWEVDHPEAWKNDAIRSRIIKYRKMANELDAMFWKILQKKNGVKKCLKILASPVGKHVRSLFDPCYSTGLIHFNRIFEYSGLNRIHDEAFDRHFAFNDFDKKTQNDMLRIVIFYYLFSGMAESSSVRDNYNPRSLGAILVPVKMRGAVWSVCAHATYFRGDESWYKDDKIWMSIFLLTTKVRENNYALFDKLLWQNIENRVRSLLSSYIGEMRDATELLSAIHKINNKLKAEQRLVPYALPEFFISNTPPPEPIHYKKIKHGDEFFCICWTIQENNFFVPRQKWSGRGTRSFHTTVSSGFLAGIDKMRHKLRIGDDRG